MGHEVSGEEERVLLGCGARMVSHHDVVVVAVERCWLWVEVAFGSVGRRAGVGVVGGVTEPSAGGASHGLPKDRNPWWFDFPRSISETRKVNSCYVARRK